MVKLDSIVIQSHEKFEEALEKLLMAGEDDEEDEDDDEDEGYGSGMDTVGENDEKSENLDE